MQPTGWAVPVCGFPRTARGWSAAFDHEARVGQLKLMHVFRRPRYPVLCEVPGDLIAAYSRPQLERRLSKVEIPRDTTLHVIDATGEGWGLHTQLMAVSPLVLKKTWTKAELIRLYRESATGKSVGMPREDKVLLRQRLDDLILAIADLLDRGSARTRRSSRWQVGAGRLH